MTLTDIGGWHWRDTQSLDDFYTFTANPMEGWITRDEDNAALYPLALTADQMAAFTFGWTQIDLTFSPPSDWPVPPDYLGANLYCAVNNSGFLDRIEVPDGTDFYRPAGAGANYGAAGVPDHPTAYDPATDLWYPYIGDYVLLTEVFFAYGVSMLTHVWIRRGRLWGSHLQDRRFHHHHRADEVVSRLQTRLANPRPGRRHRGDGRC
jgi:hypothetical protein